MTAEQAEQEITERLQEVIQDHPALSAIVVDAKTFWVILERITQSQRERARG